MKKQVFLTKDDIQQIIANSFGVDKDKVCIELYKEAEGYGYGERYATKVEAIVEMPMNE